MKTSEKRLFQMNKGLEELALWMGDLIRQGLGRLGEQDEQVFERFAAHMVDAKLGSIGRRIRSWKKFLGREDGHEQLLAEMGDLLLLVRAFQRPGSLPEDLGQDVFQLAGLAPKKEEVLEGDPVEGTWTVAGVVSGEEENLRFRRTWLQRLENGSFALLLDFAWGDQPYERSWKPGQQFKGSLVYYPSAYPMRALVREPGKPTFAGPALKGCPSLDELGRQFSQALSQQPWLQRLPVILENAIPLRTNDDHWALADKRLLTIPLLCTPETGWALLSVSGGHPISVFGEYNGATFSPLSCLSAGRLIPLSVSE